MVPGKRHIRWHINIKLYLTVSEHSIGLHHKVVSNRFMSHVQDFILRGQLFGPEKSVKEVIT